MTKTPSILVEDYSRMETFMKKFLLIAPSMQAKLNEAVSVGILAFPEVIALQKLQNEIEEFLK